LVVVLAKTSNKLIRIRGFHIDYLGHAQPILSDPTTWAAITFATRHAAGGALSAPAAALAREILRTLLIHKLRTTAVSLLLITALATGAGT
jgi:hypothetical protein